MAEANRMPLIVAQTSPRRPCELNPARSTGNRLWPPRKRQNPTTLHLAQSVGVHTTLRGNLTSANWRCTDCVPVTQRTMSHNLKLRGDLTSACQVEEHRCGIPCDTRNP